ncbi:phosphatase PAP2 family protein [Candidatus Saccharibacteria bacterium]|nr:phosphatase PAP2 family protein [Candidatus Saccharibacteria bacterium]
MSKIKQSALQIVGVVGVVISLAIFIRKPSFPTPDKLVIFLTFVFMSFHQAKEMLKRLLPFVAAILVYESFRGIAHILNTHVNYNLAINADKLLFGTLPTVTLQKWLWHGHVQWYDFMFYIPYILFFALTFGLALLVWKTREHYYWRVVSTYTILFFAAFLTFFLLPAAPPWLASQNHYIEPVTRVSSHVWYALGLNDFSLVYNKISPNPVAAIPSLHAASSTLFALFILKIYGRRWAVLAAIYPILIYIGVVYEGEHYVFDVLAGIIYALGAYLVTPFIMSWIKDRVVKLKNSSKTKSVLKRVRL